MNKTEIKYVLENNIAIITLSNTLNKPPTLDGNILNKLGEYVTQISQDNPRVTLIRSSSPRFFCVGANINVLEQTDEKTIIPWVMEGHRILNMLEDLPMPVIAVVEGYAMGGGLELAMACDLIFSSKSAKYAQSEAGLGFIPGWGGTFRLMERIGKAKAKFYFYSGKIIDSTEAINIGLVDHLCDDENINTSLNEYTQFIINNNKNALTKFKNILNNQALKIRSQLATEEAFNSISCLQDSDTKQRLNDFLTKKRRK